MPTLNVLTPTRKARNRSAMEGCGNLRPRFSITRHDLQPSWTPADGIRRLDSVAVGKLPETEGASFPFWSPDSLFVGFFANGKSTVASVAGGPTRVVCDSPGFYGGTWNKDGVIVLRQHTTIFFACRRWVARPVR